MREAQRRISRYSQRADQFDKAAVRKHAAHVAAWIAYGPKGWLPDINELQLLKKFIDRMRGGLLPSRLMEVLPETLAALQRAVATWQASEIWKQAEQELQKSLLKFRCCRRPADDAASGAAVAQDVVAVSDVECTHSGGFQLDGGEVIQVDSGDEADQSSAQASSQHLQLVSKMNEWGFLDSAQRLERLRQAEEAARRLSQAQLAEVVNTAAAALAAPRRNLTRKDQVRQQHLWQKRVRQLLLDALHLWRVKQYDCTAIAHVLDFVQGKIEKFEDNVGDIEGAAAGAIWSSIKQAVNDMLHSAEENAQSAERAFPAAKAVGPRNRLERQSGIQGISWLRFGWSVSWRDGKLKRIFFSVSKFVKQGLSEEAAVTAALEEAKTFREELVHQGKLQPSKPSKSFSSSVRGVWFSNWHQKWRVLFPDPAGKGQRISGGYFGTKEQAEAKAREMARQFGVPAETEVVPARKLSDLPYFEPLGAQKGVRWNLGEQCWHATFLCRTSKKTKNMRFRPKDLSQHEVAKMWKQAVAWMQCPLNHYPSEGDCADYLCKESDEALKLFPSGQSFKRIWFSSLDWLGEPPTVQLSYELFFNGALAAVQLLLCPVAQ
ncbi:unnamed protein product [Symbiodinium natans]|uniref:AP2/ERF domain-containing protein n=1 Tax=Symbiodinium natans TaxID=878477 RepID=A0A812SVB9_9DINO|nr:unnamed protein product [Symbiodinium natans]